MDQPSLDLKPKSPHSIPPINLNIRPINHTTRILTKKNHRIRHLPRQRKLARRDIRQKRLPNRILPPSLLPQRRPRHRRRDGIRRYPTASPLRCHAARETEQGGFGGAVGAVLVEGYVGCLGGDVYDSAGWCSGRGGGRGRGRGRVETRKCLRAEHGSEYVGGEMLHRFLGGCAVHIAEGDVAGGVDEDARECARITIT